MNKIQMKASTALFPVPTVLVSSRLGSKSNIVTIAWTGVMNSVPPMVYVGINPIRYSHRLIKESGEYVINIPSVEQAEVTDYCGTVSGKDVDKFAETGLTALPATEVQAPLIAECPVNIECGVKQIVSLGSHDVFIAEVLSVHYNEDVLDANGKPDFRKIKPYGFCGNEYWALQEKVGIHGYSKRRGK
ncbi:Flavin reductase like domain protein [Acididesulfobacillus acetoxydans]|uniref:Flavin reductase like domain protein n=2 Tax=Acididesulfobacillus acetoxydans TaxID=1561005 RepID=A0A8S0XXJ5_9FIRM|nr:flavin reductase family protein [Acididesulfobacillus acetoxydans]CAA7601797.1 Flavin reductase like domain protein [Acididesulfobacillus acetoxydans]CEJ09217.1 Flavin reductase like domain protein [Acididesulfobacillus acetoxydans]